MSEVISPQTLSDEAQAAYQRGDYTAAAQSYLAVAQSFESMNDRPSAAEARNNASVAWLKAGNVKSAYAAVDGTPAIFAESGDVRRQGIAWGNLAAALEELHRTAEAVQSYEKSIELLEACGEREYRAYVYKSLSALKLKAGKQIEAMGLMDAGLNGISELSASQKLLKKLLAIWRKLLPH
jgi:tetratricopeptide (TPR) repeat protein